MIIKEATKSAERCAFCKHWYDPLNEAIKPIRGNGLWEVSGELKKPCSKKSNMVVFAKGTCHLFESKRW